MNEVLFSPADVRPVILEGRWLGRNESSSLVAMGPAGVLEGGEDAFQEFPSWLAWHAQKYPAGAAIGFLSYELARVFEPLSLPNFDSLPDFSFGYYAQIKELPRSAPWEPSATQVHPSDIRSNFDRDTYAEAVRRIHDYITSGDIYQANLTRQFSVNLGSLSSELIFLRLAGGRAAFRAFLKSPTHTVISDSPEQFFRVRGRRILASPIKGTIARGENDNSDAMQISKLLSSAKDRSENIMIVDLLRNDLGRICVYKSIQVQLFEVVSLPHLFHLVSHVRGTLRPEVGPAEILRALFPCGSVTGAPKIRAMEILVEIERAPRGVSMGAIGIIRTVCGAEGYEMDFSVAIRTMTVHENVAVLNVGGGIVYESAAQTEYDELMLKARPLLEALGVMSSLDTQAQLACALAR